MRRPAAARRIDVFGVVQGVGFRPFVYRLARRLGLSGWVRNAGRCVEIHVEGPDEGALEAFATALAAERPPLARIERLEAVPAAARGLKDFTVEESAGGERFVFIAPDISVCRPCLEDIRNPADRRFRYPFTNCTDCGPRYTIVKALPYDRPNTTMAGFPPCPDCAREYTDPDDRRYHAQPIACPACGPSVALRDSRSGAPLPGGIEAAAALIRAGKVVAVKGLGGFHLVCDPRRPAAVRKLRRLKARDRKPFALMARDAAAAARVARLSPAERELLESSRRPIVLLRKRPGSDLPGIAPGLDEIGVMLPYTPLHALLLESLDLVVATSSNRRDAPIIKDADEGLRPLCDAILDHDRPIHMRADDSVAAVVRGRPLFFRRARGYVPAPQRVPAGLEARSHVLALGGELKDTISVYKDGYVVTSQFLGDLDEYENRAYFLETIRHLAGLFDVSPAVVVSDLHPDFHTTRHARRMGIPHLQVQHHYAHVLAALFEHGVPPGTRVLGVAWDGYGYGQDGNAWGGEFLAADYRAYERFAHFRPVALPGADLAAKEPWRMALAYLHDLGADPAAGARFLKDVSRRAVGGVWEMMSARVRSPLSSSAGRLFDAVSALTGLAPLRNEFEAEAAMRLEAAAGAGGRGSYPFELEGRGRPRQISFRPMIARILKDIEAGVEAGVIAAKFHETLSRVVLRVAERAREELGLTTVVLVGGVFLNKRLLARTEAGLEARGFRVLRPEAYSPNDESLSLGQVAYALARWSRAGLSSADRA